MTELTVVGKRDRPLTELIPERVDSLDCAAFSRWLEAIGLVVTRRHRRRSLGGGVGRSQHRPPRDRFRDGRCCLNLEVVWGITMAKSKRDEARKLKSDGIEVASRVGCFVHMLKEDRTEDRMRFSVKFTGYSVRRFAANVMALTPEVPPAVAESAKALIARFDLMLTLSDDDLVPKLPRLARDAARLAQELAKAITELADSREHEGIVSGRHCRRCNGHLHAHTPGCPSYERCHSSSPPRRRIESVIKPASLPPADDTHITDLRRRADDLLDSTRGTELSIYWLPLKASA